mgnify:CR=1 FL=1
MLLHDRTMNTIKNEYLTLMEPTTSNILILLVSQGKLSFDAKISDLFSSRYKHIHWRLR